MIFGAMIIGMGIGLVAMAATIVLGASLLSGFLAYWLASCAGTVGICVVKTLYCKAGAPDTHHAERSVQ